MTAHLYDAVSVRLLCLISPTRMQREVDNTKEEWLFLTICVVFCFIFHDAVSI
jgi:hypothetical protein